MNNRKIKKNRGGKQLGWAKMTRNGWVYKGVPSLTLELLSKYLTEIFLGSKDREMSVVTLDGGLKLFDEAMKEEVNKFMSREEAVAEEEKYGDMEDELMKRLKLR